MRSIQLLSLLLLLVTVGLSYWTLAPIEPDSSGASAGAAGLVLMFIVVPLFCCSALGSITTTIALLSPKIRKDFNFTGLFWRFIWFLNAIISLGLIALGLYVTYAIVFS
jgi:hypothetical protein